MKKMKFNIREEVANKRFEISYTVDGKEKCERFSYAKCPKEEAMAKAVEKQTELRSR